MEENFTLTKKKRILIVDDDDIALWSLKKHLETADYIVTAVENAKFALEEFDKFSYELVLTDYDMENMDGLELIEVLKEKEQPPVIIVLTGVTEANRIVKIMKAGAFDYILKPYNAEELLQRVSHAFDSNELKKVKYQIQQEKNIRLDKELAWNKWKQDLLTRSANKLDTYLFYNLKTALSQGSGFGSLLSLIFLISSQIQEIDGQYVIDGELMKLIRESAYTCSKILNQFSEIYDVISQKPILEDTSIEVVYDELSGFLRKEEVIQFKNHKLIINDKKTNFHNHFIQCNLELLFKMAKELLVNACKFSAHDSSIYVLFTIENKNLSIHFINTPIVSNIDNKEIEGIPEEYEKLIFEPFFRLNKFVDERYDSLDFGLGLTLVDKIVYIHNGEVNASNINFHLNQTPGIRTKLEVNIPLSNGDT